MRGLENLRHRIPLLEPNSALSRQKARYIANGRIPLPLRFKLPMVTIPVPLNGEANGVPRIPTIQTLAERTIPRFREETVVNMALLARLARRERNVVEMPEETVGTPKENDLHKVPAEIAEQAIHISADGVSGWLPIEASRNLEVDDLSGIEEIFFVQHGVKRNVKDYYNYMRDALGRDFDPNKTLIIATQFTNEIDLRRQKRLWQGKYNNGKGVNRKDVLHWRYIDWKAAEPAQNQSTPIDSFTAMDSVVEYILDKAKNARSLHFRGNSEGGQMHERYLAYSKKLKKLEKEKVIINGKLENKYTIEGYVAGMGTVHNFDGTRPVLLNRNAPPASWQFNSKTYKPNAVENLWPLGTYEPPPYILEYLREYTRYTALMDSERRSKFCIGELDDILDGSQLPTGPGPGFDAEGKTRLERVIGKKAVMKDTLGINPANCLIFRDLGHDGEKMFAAIEQYRKAPNEKKIQIALSFAA